MSNIAATKFAAATAATAALATFLAAGDVATPVHTGLDFRSNPYTPTRKGVKDWAVYLDGILQESMVRTHCVEYDDDTLVVSGINSTYNGTYKQVIAPAGGFLKGVMDGSNDFVANPSYVVWAKQSATSTWQVAIYDSGSSNWQLIQTSTNPSTLEASDATGAGSAVTLATTNETRAGGLCPSSADANVAYQVGWRRELIVYNQAASPANTERMTEAGTLVIRQVNLG